MPVLVEFDPAELLSGEDNRLKRQAHRMKAKSCAPLWAYKVTLLYGIPSCFSSLETWIPNRVGWIGTQADLSTLQTNSQGAHQSDLDPRRHITFWAWNERGERFGPFHEKFSYQQEQEFIAMIADRPAMPAPSPSSSSMSSSTSSSTGSLNASEGGQSTQPSSPEFPTNEDDGKPFQLVTRKRRKSTRSAGESQPIGKTRF